MYSSLIGKVEKAQRYALERERLSFSNFKASFRGEHDSYQVSYDDGTWKCSCEHFNGRQLCSHAMAVERILDGTMPQPVSAYD